MGTRGRKVGSDEGLDVEPAASAGPWKDMGDDPLTGLVASFELQTLVAGSTPDVTPTLEHSPDKAVIFDLVTMTTQSAVNVPEIFQTQNPCFRYVRWSWVTTGTPTSATANAFIEA